MTDPHGDIDVPVQDRGSSPLAEPSAEHELTHRDVRTALSDYLDGSLTPSRQRLIEAHLDACRDCRAFRDTLRQTIHALDSLPSQRAPAPLKNRILREIQDRAM